MKRFLLPVFMLTASIAQAGIVFSAPIATNDTRVSRSSSEPAIPLTLVIYHTNQQLKSRKITNPTPADVKEEWSRTVEKLKKFSPTKLNKLDYAVRFYSIPHIL